MAKDNIKKEMTISGVVDFYGYVDNYNGDGKEYSLAIRDPKFNHIDWDEIEGWYTDDKGRVKLPKMYKDLKEGKDIEIAYFKSAKYPINRVSVYNKEDKTITQVEVNNPQLKDMPVLMKLKKTYIGAILVDRVPSEFSPVAFSMDDDISEDLPF